MIEFWPSLRTFAVILQLELVSFRLADYLIFGYFGCLCCVVLPCVVWRNCVINFTVLLCIIFIHMFYRVMKGIGLYQFAENLLSYIPTKYYWNRSTSDLVIAKSKRVNLFWNTVYVAVTVSFKIDTKYRVAHKKRPQLCNDVVGYCSPIEFKQKEITVLKCNHRWTVWGLWRYTLLFWQWNTQKSIGCPKRTK